jgi:hypothetical protein
LSEPARASKKKSAAESEVGAKRVGARAQRINLIMRRSLNPGLRRIKRVVCGNKWAGNGCIVEQSKTILLLSRARGTTKLISFFIRLIGFKGIK